MALIKCKSTSTTKKPTMKTTVIKLTNTKPAIKKYTIGTIEGINQEYAYSSNKYKCRLDSLSVTSTTSEYSDYIKFEISSKMTKTRNDSSVIGYCSIVINFYDEANIKIGSTSASIGSLTVWETGINDTFTYSSANLENITGSVIRVSVSPRA